TFWSWGLVWWTPTFLVRSHGLTVGQAGAILGPMHLIGGSACLLLTSWLMTRRSADGPRYVTPIVGIGTLAATVPSLLVYTVNDLHTTIALLWIFVPVTYLFIGPSFALTQDFVPPGMRAQVVALLLLSSNVANLLLAPQLIGLLSDWLTASHGREALRLALII